LLVGAAASTLLIAGYARTKRRNVQVAKEHPLKGSLERRMKIFGSMAASATTTGRGRGSLDGELEEDMSYKNADSFGIAVV
jgi:hypothetical protein